jgi:hypothetical protein
VSGLKRLLVRYIHGYFEALDMLTFPVYYTNQMTVNRIDQPDPIEVIRVSPEDGRNIRKVADASEKLKFLQTSGAEIFEPDAPLKISVSTDDRDDES